MIPKDLKSWTFSLATFIVWIVINVPMVAAEDPAPAKDKLVIKSVVGTLGLHHTLTVEVDNLTEYLKQQGRGANKFTLYLDSRPLKGINSRLVPGTNKLNFDIERTPDSKKEWDALISRPLAADRGFKYPVLVSIGYENDDPVPSNIEHDLVVINKTGFWGFLAFFALVFFLFLRLAKRSNILRDPSASELPNGQRGAYSLGRTQMAFWFFMVAISYVLIWMLTDNRDSLSESVLGLLGISAATGLSAAVVGSSKKGEAESQLREREREKATLASRMDVIVQQIQAQPAFAILSALSNEQAEKGARQTEVDKEIAILQAEIAPMKSEGFLTDILTDVDGITLHRFQIVVWTLILGFIFISTVYTSLAMPEFSGTLLALMGISGGTYIGFKFPEKQA